MEKKWLLLSIFLLFIIGCSPGDKSMSVTEKRQIATDMEKETLDRLYRENPSTKERIKEAAGYGVFSNANIHIIYAGAGGGYGVVVNNSTGERTYMKMAMGGIGIGLGVKDYRVILIFSDKEILTKFVKKGWELGSQADAAVKAGNKGGELSGESDFREGITAYSMTESGLALQISLTGTKYWKDKKLN